MRKIQIGNRSISATDRPFIIAEIGVNYYDIARVQGSEPLEAAKLMIRRAAEAGADAVKFQSYKAESLAIKNSPAYWDRREEKTGSQYELFKKYDKFGEREFEELAKCSQTSGVVFLSTPFDLAAVDYLDPLMPAFKIASADITNMPLIRHIARKKKPVLLSTGASSLEETADALRILTEEGNDQVVVMHCILNYPTDYPDANLLMIADLKTAFPGCLIGYSDHTRPDDAMLVPSTAYLLGASVLEKHFTLDKSLSGNDHYHAMDPLDLSRLSRNVRLIRDLLGKSQKQPTEAESAARTYARRSVVARVNIPEGATIDGNDLDCKRPGTGISPMFFDSLVGKRARRTIPADTPLHWEDVE